jgi:large subunit ribosomal protein L7e
MIQENKAKREVVFKRAEQYVKEYREAEREKIRLTREAKKEGSFYVPAQPKLVFVVRIKGSVPSFFYQTILTCLTIA